MKKTVSVISVIIWLFIIFCFSAQTAEDSSTTSQSIVDFVLKILNLQNVHLLVYLVRKGAHFTLYFVLALLITKTIKIRPYVTAVLIVAVYAATDELHQMFSEGRSGELFDVIIDTAGGTLAVFWDFITKKFNLKKI